MPQVLVGNTALTSLVPSADHMRLLATMANGETHLIKYTGSKPIHETSAASAEVSVSKIASFHTGAVVSSAALPLVSASGAIDGYDVFSSQV